MRLALDTSTDRLSVALAAEGAAPLEAHVDGARRHAAAILPTVERLLRQLGAQPRDLRQVVLADGPGSFTGLRVGAAVGKALAAARGVELWAVPALAARAVAAGAPGDVVVSVLDALRGELYSAAYRLDPDDVVQVLPPRARTPDTLRAALTAPALLAGEAPPALAERLQGWALCTALGARADARHLLAALDRPGAGYRVADIAGWEPAYGRPAEAQARWEAQHGRPLPDPTGARG